MTDRTEKRLVLLIPIILAIGCFINTLSFEFVSDDSFVITKDGPIQDWQWANIARLFTKDIWAFFQPGTNFEGTPYYRPIFGLFFMLCYLFAKLEPWRWHLIGVLVHATSVLIAAKLLIANLTALNNSSLRKQDIYLFSGIGATLFAIHPLQSEPVSWIFGAANGFSTIFIFSAILTYIKAREDLSRRRRYLGLTCLLFLCALLSKELGIIVIPIILLYELIVFNPEQNLFSRVRSAFNYLWPLLLLTTGYLMVRIMIFGGLKPTYSLLDSPEPAGANLKINLLTIPAILWQDLKLIVWPFSLGPMYPVKYTHTPGWENFYLPLCLLIVVGLIMLIAAYKNSIVRISLIWLILPVLPVLDIRSIYPEFIVQDRYLYVSLIGAGLLLALLLYKLNLFFIAQDKLQTTEWRASILATCAVILLFLAALTIKQNGIWTDEWQLWNAAYENHPTSCMANLQLGELSLRAGKESEAKNHFEQLVRSCPDSVRGSYRLGVIYRREGDLARAEESFKHMVILAPNNERRATALFNLGLIYQQQGELLKARYFYQEGLTLDPNGESSARAKVIIAELNNQIAKESSK